MTEAQVEAERRRTAFHNSMRKAKLESEIIAGLLGVDNAEHTKYVKPPPTIV